MIEDKLLVLVVNDMVIFPNTEVRLEYDNIKDTKMIDLVNSCKDNLCLIVNPINDHNDITSLPNIGVLSRIKLKINVPNGKTRIVLEGLDRVEIYDVIEKENKFFAEYNEIILDNNDKENTYYNILIKSLEKYINTAPFIGNAVLGQLENISDLSELCDLIASYLPINYEFLKKYITTVDPIKRTKMLISDMKTEMNLIALEQKIEKEVEKELNDVQKEYFLKEKIKMIKKELGDKSTKENDIEKLKTKANKLKCNNKIKKKILEEIDKYESLSVNSLEISIVREYINWMLSLPWKKYTKDNNNLKEVKRMLNSSHYGLDDVKERILEYLAVKQNTNNLRSPILCLVGPPGVGKTSLALSIAKSLGREFAKISVGGINDEAEIVGHRRTYVGASPGRIISGIKKCGTANPVFIIDEIDKMTKDIKGDPASSLLEVLDPEQNKKFSDHYIEEEFDLSQVMFIATANYPDQIPYELRDRLEIINISSYTEYEKLNIAKEYLIPKCLEEHGLTELEVRFSDSVIKLLIRCYTKEAGVRELERVISSLLRKIVKKILLEQVEVFFEIDEDMVKKLLGKEKYTHNELRKKDEVGVVNGMAYTIFGGDILPVEVNMFKGKGKLILTGSLGEVMQESCNIALDFIKSSSKLFNIDNNLFLENDIHIHVPEGAISKDGPSAGIALTTALISLLLNKSVSQSISMTGEITLRGKVLPIGGVKEKVIGAHRAGIKKIFMPLENKKELDTIPDEVKKDIKFIWVDDYIEIYKKLFK